MSTKASDTVSDVIATRYKYSCFFSNDTATTEIYTLSLHDALPICDAERVVVGARGERGSDNRADLRSPDGQLQPGVRKAELRLAIEALERHLPSADRPEHAVMPPESDACRDHPG